MKRALLLSMILIAGCVSQRPVDGEVGFFTDGFTIYGDYYEGGEKAIILIHMLGSDRSAWGTLPKELNAAGYTVLNIDLRGHGKSVGRGPMRTEWPKFTEDDFSGMASDVEGAKDFLKERRKKQFAIIGASIGANVALNFAYEVPIDALVLLSPGLDYRGLRTEGSMNGYSGKVLLIASEDDREAAGAARTLEKIGNAKKETKIFGSGGHGTDMLKQNEITEFVFGWIEGNF